MAEDDFPQLPLQLLVAMSLRPGQRDVTGSDLSHFWLMPLMGKGMCLSCCSLLPLCWDAHVMVGTEATILSRSGRCIRRKAELPYWMWTIAL